MTDSFGWQESVVAGLAFSAAGGPRDFAEGTDRDVEAGIIALIERGIRVSPLLRTISRHY